MVMARKERYTTGVIMEKPRNTSVTTIAKIGMSTAKCLRLKNVPAKSAVAVMGATLGG